MFDAIVCTQWINLEGNIVCKEEDIVIVSLKSGEVAHGEIVSLNGNIMSLDSQMLGEIEIDIESIADLEIE
ncbi:MAG: hypothetical protein RSF87_12490 [Cellulosilyticaceae bacterium]